ncbi:E3 ubiquitin-protein ligase RAD18 [Diretmus argenteus]
MADDWILGDSDKIHCSFSIRLFFWNVDDLLRCPICFDFLNTSMMTKCSHNFCSYCIRKFFSCKLQCPVCNSHATEQDLRNNRILDDLVLNFQAVRQQLSKVNFDSRPISPETPSSSVKCRTPKRGPKNNGSILSHFFPKASPAKGAQQVGSVAHCVLQKKKQKTCTRTTNNSDLHSLTAPPTLSVKEELMEEEVASAQGLLSVKQEEMEISSPVSQPSKADYLSPFEDMKPVIKVECPVCSVGISQRFINRHLDTCLTRGEKTDRLRRRRRPMKKLVYHLLSMQELKRKLKECHLSVQGQRDQLVKRHQEFVLIYNAQCDSLNPRSAEDIAKGVEANEKTRNQLKGKATSSGMVFSKNQSEEEIDAMHSNYRKQHGSEFSRLIAQYRGRLETRPTQIKPEFSDEGKDAHEPQAEDGVAESNNGVLMLEEEASAGNSRSASPAYSDVSISSSLSDIFGPERTRSLE